MHSFTFTPPSQQPVGTAPCRALRVLYADDVKELREVIRLTLLRDGHTVECAVNGAEALKQLEADPTGVDLLITDHHMPVMNGLELITRVRALPRFHGRTVVFTSALSLQVAQAYRRLGVDGMIPKPIFPSELRRIIQGLFPTPDELK